MYLIALQFVGEDTPRFRHNFTEVAPNEYRHKSDKTIDWHRVAFWTSYISGVVALGWWIIGRIIW